NSSQLASTTLLPFSRDAFRRYNRWVADTWWGWCVSIGKELYGVKLLYSGDEIPEKENAIVFSNHQQMTDTTFLMFFGKDKGRLGDMKYFAKYPIKYVPAVGWGMRFIDCIFVKRDWAKDETSIRETFERFTRDKIPLWLVSFVEGTRITPTKHERSIEYARTQNLPELRHVMVPRTKGFVASVTGLRDHVTAVYDITIGYPEGVPTLWQYVRGMARVAHMHIRRFPIAELPTDSDALARWVLDRFVEKDALLDEYYRTGTFPGSSGPAK
ncbi:1-acyl-sn-glycerol-3-phosphate acyltransferase, partial [Myxococcota bacterium]|nr:1-acyl-sn-glycerol-3-phosphate acyltransferase [Myxococcota bacterium]